MLVTQMLHQILLSPGNESCNGPAPFRYKSFRLKLSQDGRLDAHPNRIFRVLEKYIDHHIVLGGTN